MTAQLKQTTQQNRIGKALIHIFAVALMVLVASYPIISEATSDKGRRPLDLPSGGGRDKDEAEQPLPDLIQFFGHDFEGDAFVWVLDVSDSMNLDGRISDLRAEFIGAVTCLSGQSDFGAIAFGTNMNPFDLDCSAADNARKGSASAWISSIVPYGGTCMAPAVIQGLEIVRKSNRSNRRLIVVGDGLPECPPPANELQTQQTLNHIAMANWDHIPIDTVFLGGWDSGCEFFQRLAVGNSGRFVNAQ